MDFLEVAGKLGVPVAIMFAMGTFFWTVAKWLKPRADQLIDSHLSFVATVQRTSEENSETIKALLDKSVCRFDQSTCPAFQPMKKKEET